MADISTLRTGDIIRIQMCNNEIVTGILKRVNKKFNTLDLYCCAPENSHSHVIFSLGGQYCPSIVDIQDVRLVTEDEINEFYNKIISIYEKEETYLYEHLSDEVYYELKDWFGYKCATNTGDGDYPGFVVNFAEYAWDFICKKSNKLANIVIDNQSKLVSLDKVCEVLKQNISKYTTIKTHGCYGENFWKEIVMTDNGIEEFRRAMGSRL